MSEDWIAYNIWTDPFQQCIIQNRIVFYLPLDPFQQRSFWESIGLPCTSQWCSGTSIESTPQEPSDGGKFSVLCMLFWKLAVVSHSCETVARPADIQELLQAGLAFFSDLLKFFKKWLQAGQIGVGLLSHYMQSTCLLKLECCCL